MNMNREGRNNQVYFSKVGKGHHNNDLSVPTNLENITTLFNSSTELTRHMHADLDKFESEKSSETDSEAEMDN
jgi:hypothetical protein